MSTLTAPVLGFKQDYNNLGDSADVDVSVDGGATWATVLHQTTDVRGPREDVLPLPMAAGQPDVQFRFHHYDADYDWWWEVDDVFIGNRTCDPVAGGLVVGNVRDATGPTADQRRDRDQPATSRRRGHHAGDPGRRRPRGRLLLAVLVADRVATRSRRRPTSTRRRRKQVERRRRLPPTANFQLGAGHLTVTPTSLSDDASSAGGKVTRRSPSPTTGRAGRRRVQRARRRLRDAAGRRHPDQPAAGSPARRVHRCSEIKADVFAAHRLRKGPRDDRPPAAGPHDEARGPTSPTTRPR